MNIAKFFGVLALVALAVLVGCRKAKPILPKRPVPTGTFQMHFINKVRGPVDLVVDGVRIPVERRTKKARLLTISGLSEGKHSYHISGLIEVFGPDVGEIEIGTEGGIFQVHFSNRLKTSINRSRDTATPASVGIPGVLAVLE